MDAGLRRWERGRLSMVRESVGLAEGGIKSKRQPDRPEQEAEQRKKKKSNWNQVS